MIKDAIARVINSKLITIRKDNGDLFINTNCSVYITREDGVKKPYLSKLHY